jgi:hypothetical protein
MIIDPKPCKPLSIVRRRRMRGTYQLRRAAEVITVEGVLGILRAGLQQLDTTLLRHRNRPTHNERIRRADVARYRPCTLSILQDQDPH